MSNIPKQTESGLEQQIAALESQDAKEQRQDITVNKNKRKHDKLPKQSQRKSSNGKEQEKFVELPGAEMGKVVRFSPEASGRVIKQEFVEDVEEGSEECSSSVMQEIYNTETLSNNDDINALNICSNTESEENVSGWTGLDPEEKAFFQWAFQHYRRLDQSKKNDFCLRCVMFFMNQYFNTTSHNSTEIFPTI